jgi:CRISPR-associated endonuclease/helicase Cas3
MSGRWSWRAHRSEWEQDVTFAHFEEMFTAATVGYAPFDWQRRFAADDLPQVVRIPTGAGKTEGCSLGWLWRRRFAAPEVRAATPRRLVYCLPMRTLVEQTVTRIRDQHARLGLDIDVHQLMGGTVESDWVDRPEDDAVLVGTLDQLFSRALMRGYGESRFRWPIDYGLLHSDCLWVLDEVQLFGEALATSTQIEGIRAALPNRSARCATVWMSATVEPGWLETVDHPAPSSLLQIAAEDRVGDLARRLAAEKPIREIAAIDAPTVAGSHATGTLTLVVVNTVRTARELSAKIRRVKGLDAEVLLLHSRFRPGDRRQIVETLMSPLPPAGRIVVATQVVEAGVDISAATLFTESAPWGSLVQRFGRSNRLGRIENAQVLWAPCGTKTLPYEEGPVRAAEATLRSIEGGSVGPDALAELDAPLDAPTRRHVLRRRDFVGLFDTAPDLSGLDLDISRFVRDSDDVTASLAWRELGDAAPPDDAPHPSRDELCPVALSELAEALKRANSPRVFRFDHIDEQWVRIDRARPGDRLIADVSFGCYSPDGGFDPKRKEPATTIDDAHGVSDEAIGQDPLASNRGGWLSLAEHTQGVCDELDGLIASLADVTSREADTLRTAARFHDWGKAHQIFQEALRSNAEGMPVRLADALIAKRVGRAKRYARRGFRHELASTLAYLAAGEADPLAAYLIASHHGRVRLGARALPREAFEKEPRVLGCQTGDRLPEADLGGGVSMLEIELDLSPLQLGAEDGETYTDMALSVLDEFGPVRLAYLEAILRTADRRRSAKEQEATHA